MDISQLGKKVVSKVNHILFDISNRIGMSNPIFSFILQYKIAMHYSRKQTGF